MAQVYAHLSEAAAAPCAPSVSEGIGRIDAALEECLLAPATKHVGGLASGALAHSLGKLDPLFARLWRQDAGAHDAAPVDTS